MEEISFPRERLKWSLGLGHNLKALGLTCVRSQSSREINNATISVFSTFLKINKSREQFLLRLTIFYPIYGYRLKFFNCYGYRLNFWPFYAYRLTPLRHVFMLGALGIMRANGGYVMRTAFRRVHHAYCWVVFK